MTSTQRRRTQAAGLCVLLIVGLVFWAYREPVGYTLYSPGPTVDVLGSAGKGEPIITIKGHRSYHDDGQLRLVTVYETGVAEKVSLARALLGWADPKVNVYPHDAVYQKQDTSRSVKQQSTLEMTSSQDSATAAALHALGIDFRQAVKVVSVSKGAPADGSLKPGDLLTAVDGRRTRSTTALVARVKALAPGSHVRLSVVRGDRHLTVRLVTTRLGKSGKARHQSRIGVGIAPSFRFPFEVRIHLSQDIGGPSAGMMFALGIYDSLTKGSLTDGKVIAGTGTIDPQGRVGEIGGVQQKVAAAQRDGARLFLVPAGNCAEALGADYDPDKIRLVKVRRLTGAIHDIEKWAADPSASLTSCSPGRSS